MLSINVDTKISSLGNCRNVENVTNLCFEEYIKRKIIKKFSCWKDIIKMLKSS